MKLLNKSYVNLTDEQLAGLKELALRNGSPVAEEIRRAVAAYLDAQKPKREER